jgi:hypothetical protein
MSEVPYDDDSKGFQTLCLLGMPKSMSCSWKDWSVKFFKETWTRAKAIKLFLSHFPKCPDVGFPTKK